MIPKLNRGRSFKGLLAYLTSDKREPWQQQPETADRVGFVQTLNFFGDAPAGDGQEAARQMALTWKYREDIKRAAGIKPGGTKAEGPPVWHTSLAWAKGETPDQAEKTRAVASYLKHQGLGLEKGYQTIIVEHTDTDHPHVHIVVNLVHPEHGRQIDPFRDWQKGQAWARAYEKSRGQVFCHDREAKHAEIDRKRAATKTRADFARAAADARAAQLTNPARAPRRSSHTPYHVWRTEKEARSQEAQSAASQLKRALDTKYQAMQSRHDAAHQIRQDEIRQARHDRQVGRAAIYAKYATALDSVWKPATARQDAVMDTAAWAEMARHLSDRRSTFDGREHTLFGRWRNANAVASPDAGLFGKLRLTLDRHGRHQLFEHDQRTEQARLKPANDATPTAQRRSKAPEAKKAQSDRIKAMRAAELATHDSKQAAAAAALQARHQFQQQAERAEKDAFRAAAKAAWEQHRETYPEQDPPPTGPRPTDDPAQVIEALTSQHSTFTRSDLDRYVGQHAQGADATAAKARVFGCAQLVMLGKDQQGRERFTARDLHGIERRMMRDATAMAQQDTHAVSQRHQDRALHALGITLSDDQATAFRHIVGKDDCAAVIGFAGGGKTTLLDAARRAWEGQGYRVQGCALSGVAADGLRSGAGIDSATIHSRLHAWDKGKDALTAKDVLVMDEAGMVGSRLMGRVMDHATRAGAKVVLVGDPEQLQAIEAGSAFKAITDKIGAAEINSIRRQREEWQQQATRDLATGGTAKALRRYEEAGMIHRHADQDGAKDSMIAEWDQARADNPAQTQIMLAYTRDDVRDLNERARKVRQDRGELGEDHVLQTDRGERAFAAQDRIYFLKNDKTLDVRNGTLATVEKIAGNQMSARLDDGRKISFSMADYDQVDHGYAATIHKSQGVTVDRAHVLASRYMDRHAAYVALSRHRDRVDLHWSKEAFSSRAVLSRSMGRKRIKDTSLDYEIGQDDAKPRGDASRPSPNGGGDHAADMNIEPPDAMPERKADRFGRNRDRQPRPPRPPRGDKAKDSAEKSTALNGHRRPVDAFCAFTASAAGKPLKGAQEPNLGKGEDNGADRPGLSEGWSRAGNGPEETRARRAARDKTNDNDRDLGR